MKIEKHNQVRIKGGKVHRAAYPLFPTPRGNFYGQTACDLWVSSDGGDKALRRAKVTCGNCKRCKKRKK